MHAKPREDQPPSLLFDHVSVIYPGAVTPALGDFTLRVAAGEIVALMGPTGSGKSTVLNLILGLAQASAGVVNVEGGVFAAWASQSPVTTPGTLADNIALGRLGASAEDIAEAAHAVGLGCDLARPIDERGGGLSGGERRRLALARAMLRDAPLLLLDEPTAHLDSRSEAELLPVIARLARGRTTLIATHSDALAALADRIVRLA